MWIIYPRLLVLVALIAGALFVLALALTPVTPGSYRSGKSNKPSAPAAPPQAPTFVDVTLRAGLLTSHTQRGDHLQGLDEALGPGVCTFDYDGDGWLDLLTIGGSGQTRYYGDTEWWHESPGLALFRNLRDGRFQDVTDGTGLDALDWGMGCAHADLDNDGDQDLILTNLGTNRLYRNEGNGRFSDVTAESGINGARWSTSAAVADFDGDGLLDVYVVNYLRFRKGERTYERASGFKSDVGPSFDPRLYDSAANRLYRNLGNLRFEDVTAPAGVANSSGRGLDALWLDANGDGRPDLFVSNDAGLPSALFVNLGNGRFENQAEAYRLKSSTGGRGAAVGNIGGNGHADLIVTTGLGLPIRAYVFDGDDGNRGFVDVARDLGLSGAGVIDHSGWGAVLADLNLDGRQDLVVGRGLVVPDSEAPKMPQGQPNALWLGGEDGRMYQAGSLSPDVAATRGVIAADFDNDGDQDLYLANNNGTGQFLRNQALDADGDPRRWVGFRLRGSESNRDAIGARVALRQADRDQVALVTAGGGFLSDGDRRVVFGLAPSDEALAVAVTWPDGSVTQFNDIEPGRYWSLDQDGSAATALGAEPRDSHVPRLRLALHADKPEFRAAYVEMIVEHFGADAPADEIEAAVADPDELVRRTAVEALSDPLSNSGLRFLPGLLDDPEPETRIAAIRGLRAYESEYTVRWLLAALDDGLAEVRCATAEVFGAWYKEEEAVLVQKYRGVPPLIRMLADDNASVRHCAARALGAAERFRAVPPLLQRLSDPDVGVRAEVVRALGLIRDRMALDPLITVVRNKRQPPEVRGKALIALRRLSFAGFDSLVAELLSRTEAVDAPESIDAALAVLTQGLSDPVDGIVIPKPAIRRVVLAHFASASPLPVDASGLLDLLRDVPIKQSRRLLRRIADGRNPADAARALAMLLAKGREGSDEDQARFRIASAQMQNATMVWMRRDRTGLPTPLLFERLSEPETFAAAADLVGRRHRAAAQALLKDALHTDAKQSRMRFAALDALTRIGATQDALPEELLADASLLPVSLTYWGASMRRVRTESAPACVELALHDEREPVLRELLRLLETRVEPWARLAVERLLMRRDAPVQIRRAALAAVVNQKNRRSERIIHRLSRFRSDPLAADTIPLLLRYESEKAGRSFQTRMESGYDEKTRILARALFDHAPLETINLLRRH